ncbi:unnamed protein product [Prunus armeniaca]|uniref:FAD-binding domain-containing protein n=1 Tax=Prunus armeniaca TaxID=36596 RepID=A0A6J5XPK9_PRUAR|nr:unnamed protein product [Prunus armeniaca]
MEAEADVVIVGAGISGLATSLGLHRLGIRSLVLESSDSLRTTGFALTTWTNAWKALRCPWWVIFSPCITLSCPFNYPNMLCSQIANLDQKELEENPAQLKQYMSSKLGKIPDKVKAVVENTELDAFISSPLRYRHPWELLWGNISKGNACVAGDALHPMTPDIGQGGCCALEDSVVLARCLGEALLKNSGGETKDKEGEEGKGRV